MRFPATNGEDAAIEPVLLNMGAVVTVRFQSTTTTLNEIPIEKQPVFDEVIRLEGFQLDLDLNEVILNWKAEMAPDEDYTVFAHMLDADGNIVTQADAPPRLPTSYWRWGETYSTFHRFPANFNMLDHEVIVGLYLNDGLGYPKAEYLMTVENEEIDEEGLDDLAADEPEDEDYSANDSEFAPAIESDFVDPLLETEVAFDSFSIPWETATEVLALTPQPTEEASDARRTIKSRPPHNQRKRQTPILERAISPTGYPRSGL